MPKAKELRPFVERLITIAKRGVAAGAANGKTLHARRLVLAELPDTAVVGKLFDTIAPRFAELCGASSPAQLVGRRLPDLVHPDFAELLSEHLRRHREGQPAPVRLEVELRPVAGHTPRVELSFARVSYDAQPALLVSAVEISSRADKVNGVRGRATAWSALDSLSEGVLTTDIDGRSPTG